jgi:hypothetical protein
MVSLGLLKKRAGNISAHPGLTAVAQEMLPTIEVVGSFPASGSEIDIDQVPSEVLTRAAAVISHTKTPDLEKRSRFGAGRCPARRRRASGVQKRQFLDLRGRRVDRMYLDRCIWTSAHGATRPSFTSISWVQTIGRRCGHLAAIA